jgi:hypothetical protein
MEPSLALETAKSATGQRRFLLVCKSYLKRAFSPAEAELKEWYELNMREWPETSLSPFLDELEVSAKATPHGNERRSGAEEDSSRTKLMAFLGNLASKHRPK